tara:strand:- start:652 stop:879 length:228 start_codon:yes stop_codon:yes gene_type:complete
VEHNSFKIGDLVKVKWYSDIAGDSLFSIIVKEDEETFTLCFVGSTVFNDSRYWICDKKYINNDEYYSGVNLTLMS